jgi:ribosomal protein L11 methyltransferase
MRPNAPIYIWRKSARRDWFAQHDATIAAMAGGNLAVIEEPGRKQLQLEACTSRAIGRRLLQNFRGQMEKLPRDWQKRFFSSQSSKPIRIGPRLAVINSDAAAKVPQASSSVLHIPAGVAFGTGEHATTAMSLRILERLTRTRAAGWSLFDAGTGSGIFALAATRFGAGKIVAIDNDPIAIFTAKQNARANQITGVRFGVGDAKKALRGRFDFITANLYSDLLVKMLPRFRQSLDRNGRLILSGVLRAQEPEFIRALRANRFHIAERRRRGKWVALAVRHATKT